MPLKNQKVNKFDFYFIILVWSFFFYVLTSSVERSALSFWLTFYSIWKKSNDGIEIGRRQIARSHLMWYTVRRWIGSYCFIFWFKWWGDKSIVLLFPDITKVELFLFSFLKIVCGLYCPFHHVTRRKLILNQTGQSSFPPDCNLYNYCVDALFISLFGFSEICSVSSVSSRGRPRNVYIVFTSDWTIAMRFINSMKWARVRVSVHCTSYAEHWISSNTRSCMFTNKCLFLWKRRKM